MKTHKKHKYTQMTQKHLKTKTPYENIKRLLKPQNHSINTKTSKKHKNTQNTHKQLRTHKKHAKTLK